MPNEARAASASDIAISSNSLATTGILALRVQPARTPGKLSPVANADRVIHTQGSALQMRELRRGPIAYDTFIGLLKEVTR
jgi:hypothetical protein